MPKWTPQQSRAIQERNANILVSAAAGSGKTAVLVERILRLMIDEDVQLTEMLIVTFTNAAAGEMRERILAALLAEMNTNKEKASFLRHQISLISQAPIKTLHAFCKDVLRQNFHQLDIDPDFRIGDMSELAVLKQQVMDALMEDAYEKGEPSFLQLVESYSGNRNDDRLQTMLFKLHTFLMSKPEPEGWLNSMLKLYDLNLDEIQHHPWVQTLLKDARDAMEAARGLLHEALKICAMDEGPAAYSLALESDLKMVEDLEDAMDEEFALFLGKVSNISYDRLKTISKKEKEQLSENLIDRVKKLRDHMKKDMIDPIRKTFGSFDNVRLLEETEAMKPLMMCLGELALAFDVRYIEAKRDKDILDFNDLEHLTIQLFKTDDIAAYYRRQFQYIFVDEYQDSNIVQETILGAIKRSNNLFMVGDVKQSIYKFRLADPSLFLEKYESYPSETGSENLKIDLNKNFRSRPEILSGINFIFEHLMSKKFGDIAYDEAAALYPGMSFEALEAPALNVSLLDVDPPDVELDEALQDMSKAEAEARAIATEIKKCLKVPLFDPRKGVFRSTTYRDMVLLLRATRSWAPVFQEVFEEEGIPLYAESNTGYFEAMEIRILLDFLRVIDNKQQDLSLMSVFRSPIFGFSTENLVAIRMKYPKMSYYNALISYGQEHEDALAKKVNEAFKAIENYKLRAQYEKLNELIWSILIDTKYFHYMGALPGGDVRQGNLKILVNHADEFERSSLTGLFSFIRYLELVTQSSGDMGEARTIHENEDVLRLMSIHKSKGLEFPVVFVAGLGKQFNQMDLRNDLILHKDLGLTARYVDSEKRTISDSLGVKAAKNAMKFENLAEEMRILYVALTRAVDKLYLFGTVKNLDKELDRWLRGNSVFFLKKAMHYLGWIMPLLLAHPDGQALIQKQDKESLLTSFDSSSHWTIETQHIQEVMERKIQQLMDDETMKDTLLYGKQGRGGKYSAWIQQQFNWKYPYEGTYALPPKISVTELQKMKGQEHAIELPELVETPKFIRQEEVMAGAEFGTLIHAFMEHVTLMRIMDRNHLLKELQRLVETRLLTEEDAKIIRLNKIEKFYHSSIGKRMLASENVKREQPFVMRENVSDFVGVKTEDVIVQGIIDCCFEEDGAYVIIDYKTDSTKEQTAEELAQKYQTQLELYAKALSKGSGKPVKEAFLYLFSSDESVRVL